MLQEPTLEVLDLVPGPRPMNLGIGCTLNGKDFSKNSFRNETTNSSHIERERSKLKKVVRRISGAPQRAVTRRL